MCSFCRFDKNLKLPSLPDMVFGDNFLRIMHEDGYGIEFNALDALRLVNDNQDLMKVAIAKAWAEARADSEYVSEVLKPFDWTFTTNYKGTIFGKGDKVLMATPTTQRIDMEKLKQQEKIMFYEEIHLFEDELADHGSASCNIKIRVMPSAFFVLLRFYLRIDNVLIRINDTRLYHETGTKYMLREYSSRENSADKLKVSSTVLTDPNEVFSHLLLKEEIIDILEFPK